MVHTILIHVHVAALIVNSAILCVWWSDGSVFLCVVLQVYQYRL